MRILIVPLIRTPKDDASYSLCRNLLSLFLQEGHICAVSCDSENQFHHVSFYESVPLQPSRLSSRTEKSYEGWLYAQGAGSTDYLKADTENLLSVIHEFKPHLIISLDRTAALIAAKRKGIRCFCIVHAGMYKPYVSKKPIQYINAVLSAYGLEQILKMNDLLLTCERRIGFSPIQLSPFPIDADVTRVGIASVFPLHAVLTNRVCFFFHEKVDKPQTFRKIIKESFLGAPYALYISYPGCKTETDGNLHFIKTPKDEYLSGSIACIHDGNDYYMNQCAARGIPQLVLYNHDCIRISNALSVQRNRIGTALDIHELKVSSLYEKYRELMVNDAFYDNNQIMASYCRKAGDLSEIIKYLKKRT